MRTAGRRITLALLLASTCACDTEGGSEPVPDDTFTADSSGEDVTDGQDTTGGQDTADATGGPRTLSRVDIDAAAHPMAVCNDGSPPVFYFRPGTGEGADKWVIWFEGGGSCFDAETCAERWQTEHGKMSSKNKPMVAVREGIVSDDPSLNPDFYQWNHVVMDYCTSDTWTGARDSEALTGFLPDQPDRSIVFRGRYVTDAIFAALRDPAIVGGPTLADASAVLLTGTSAGGTGLRNNVDRLATTFGEDVDLRAVSDATVPPIVTPEGESANAARSKAKLAAWEPIFDESCHAAHADEPEQCLNGAEMVAGGFIGVPTFFHMDQRDPKALAANLLTDPVADAIAIDTLGAETRALLEQTGGAFVPARGQHTILTGPRFGGLTDEGEPFLVDGRSMAEVLHAWYASTGEETFAMDVAEDTGCHAPMIPAPGEVAITDFTFYAQDIDPQLAQEPWCVPEQDCGTGNPYPQKPHRVAVAEDGPTRDHLFVFLGGSGGNCNNHMEITGMAAQAGFRAICLGYVNDPSIQTYCGGVSNESACRPAVRGELVTGEDLSDRLDIGRHNSIEGRLVALLKYLHDEAPQLGWSEYVDPTTKSPIWSKIAIAGFSQGGGHAGLIAQGNRVARAIFFSKGAGAEPKVGVPCSGDDDCDVGICAVQVGNCMSQVPAEWGKDPGLTPSHRRFGIVHTKESAWGYSPDVFKLWQMDHWGDFVDVDSAEPPFSCSHMLSTSVEPPEDAGYHGSMGGDGAMARDENGVPINRDAYMTMMMLGW